MGNLKNVCITLIEAAIGLNVKKFELNKYAYLGHFLQEINAYVLV